MPPPIALSDEQLSAIMRACEPLRPDARAGFLEAVAAALQDREMGDGTVYLAIARAQKLSAASQDGQSAVEGRPCVISVAMLSHCCIWVIRHRLNRRERYDC